MSSVYVAACSVPEKSVRRSLALQIGVAALLALAIASYFWIDSRYPALLKKLHVGKSIRVTAAITFDALLPVKPDMPLFTRVERTTVNWIWANRIGMTFGVCFGAAMLTLLPLLPYRRLRTPAANTLLGAVLGTPLGVCANCVAPIGQGMVDAGASTQTVLATMISSPLLNVVVLAMAFTLFPLPIALTRLAVPLVLLALVPLIAPAQPTGLDIPLPNTREGGWADSLGTIVTRFLKNLTRIAVITVPLMLLAAFFGALTAELLPAQSIPATASLIGILLVALIGTFLPVPMAFDVAVAFVLMTNQVPLPYVAALLCTLGAFSIYPFLIVGRSISWRTATSMFVLVTAIGVVAGVGTALAQHWF